MRWLSLTLLPFVLVACTETQASLDETPQFDFSNAPDVSGIVTRAEWPVAYTWPDFKTGLRVTLGLDMLEFCDGIDDFDVIPYQDVNSPTGELLTLGKGTLRAAVWPFTDFDCALFTTIAPLATGDAEFVNNDNDLLGTPGWENNTNVWGFSAHGLLTRPTGEIAVLSAERRVSFSAARGLMVLMSKVSLQ